METANTAIQASIRKVCPTPRASYVTFPSRPAGEEREEGQMRRRLQVLNHTPTSVYFALYTVVQLSL